MLHYYPYKFRCICSSTSTYWSCSKKRILIAIPFLNEVYNTYPWNILWTYAAHFHRNGAYNTRNCRMILLCRIFEATVESAILRFKLVAGNGGTAHWTYTAMSVICKIYYDDSTKSKPWFPRWWRTFVLSIIIDYYFCSISYRISFIIFQVC